MGTFPTRNPFPLAYMFILAISGISGSVDEFHLKAFSSDPNTKALSCGDNSAIFCEIVSCDIPGLIFASLLMVSEIASEFAYKKICAFIAKYSIIFDKHSVRVL